nr:uncharacterized protein LOC109185273 [Ipomoea batatas]
MEEHSSSMTKSRSPMVTNLDPTSLRKRVSQNTSDFDMKALLAMMQSQFHIINELQDEIEGLRIKRRNLRMQDTQSSQGTNGKLPTNTENTRQQINVIATISGKTLEEPLMLHEEVTIEETIKKERVLEEENMKKDCKEKLLEEDRTEPKNGQDLLPYEEFFDDEDPSKHSILPSSNDEDPCEHSAPPSSNDHMMKRIHLNLTTRLIIPDGDIGCGPEQAGLGSVGQAARGASTPVASSRSPSFRRNPPPPQTAAWPRRLHKSEPGLAASPPRRLDSSPCEGDGAWEAAERDGKWDRWLGWCDAIRD